MKKRLIGVFMKKLIKETFQLTEAGAEGVIRASILQFLSTITMILPVMLVFLFAFQVLNEEQLNSWPYVIGVVTVVIVIVIVQNFSYNATYKATYQESENLRIEIATILRELPLSYFSRHNLTDLSQAVMKDVADIEHALSHAIPQILGTLSGLFVLLIMMLVGNVKLGLCVVVPALLSLVFILASKRTQVRETKPFFYARRRSAQRFQEAIEMQNEITSYGYTDKYNELIDKECESVESALLKGELVQAGLLYLSQVFTLFVLGLVVFVGSKLYSTGQISLLFLIGYIMFAAKITDLFIGINACFAEIFHLDQTISRIKEIKTTPTQTGNSKRPQSFGVEFEDVTFSYNEGVKVLDAATFSAPQNQVTALVGPSGCGKTTALRLVSRLYDFDSGSITIGGVDIKSIDPHDLYTYISFVFQDVVLFNTSVLENIRIGRKDATDEEVKRAAQLANCEEFILELPEGYDTLIGENGKKLSGGERQRLSIARALLKDAPILLLDEIGASLDVENEAIIQKSLTTLIQNRTVLIISHRMNSIKTADTIVVFKEGTVEAQGTHDELLECSPTYRLMVERSQLTEQYTY